MQLPPRRARGFSNNAGQFGYYDHKFPIRGKHTYGDGIGAPRAGHTHQGQDVFADCGTPLEAARGGKVQFNGYHGAAGNYIVIDGRKTGRDYVYMHLKRKSAFGTGEKVKTGEQIGQVGETGNASGCHLHFELWSPPGWYEGGNFLRSVTKQMKKWDKWSERAPREGGLRVAAATGTLLVATGIAAGNGQGAAKPPRVHDVVCVERCAGARKAATGATVRLTGRRLANVAQVTFAGGAGELTAAPSAAGNRVVEVAVPEGAVTGRPRALDSTGRGPAAPRLEDRARGGAAAAGELRPRFRGGGPHEGLLRRQARGPSPLPLRRLRPARRAGDARPPQEGLAQLDRGAPAACSQPHSLTLEPNRPRRRGASRPLPVPGRPGRR